jgi:hypothetical protein
VCSNPTCTTFIYISSIPKKRRPNMCLCTAAWIFVGPSQSPLLQPQ